MMRSSGLLADLHQMLITVTVGSPVYNGSGAHRSMQQHWTAAGTAVAGTAIAKRLLLRAHTL